MDPVQVKRPFDHLIDEDTSASSAPISRSSSLQSLNNRTDALAIGTGASGTATPVDSDSSISRSKRARVSKPLLGNFIELSDSSDTDDDLIFVELVGRDRKGKEKEKERENLGPWWNENEMSKRREQFLLANVATYLPLLPGDTGYYAKLLASYRRSGKPLPTKPVVPYRRLGQPSLIAKDAIMKDYQLGGLSFLAHCAENGMNCILGDEMGLGKTLQTLSLIAHLAETQGAKGPHLLACPLSVLSSWMTEIARWLPGFKAMRFHGTQSARALLKDDFVKNAPDLVVTTYEAFTAEQVFFKNRKLWGIVCLDEGHRVKNAESQAAMAVQGIRARMRIILSGTPLQNNLVELWSLLHFLDPLVFHEKTMLPFKTSFDLSAGNYDQKFLHKSQRFLELVMLRRTKEGVSSQITVPPREEITLYVPLSPAQKFWTKALLARTEATVLAEIFSDFEGQAANKKGKLNGVKSEGSGLKAEEGVLDLTDDGEHQVRANVQRVIEESKQKSQQFGGNDWKKMMNLLMQLRKVCDHPYLLPGAESEPFEVAEHIVAASSKLIVLDKLLASIIPKGEKVLIFSGFTMMLDILEDFLHLRDYKYCRLDGSTSRPRRSLDIRLFQQKSSPYQIYLISTRAGGLGINLTAASTVVMFDQDWNPQVDLQAIARAHRIGQEKNVKVFKLVSQDSVEEQMLTRLRKKLYLSAKVMGSMRNRNEQEGGIDGDVEGAGEKPSKEDEAPKMTRGELAGILRGGAGALAKWSNTDGSDPFETFKASTFDEITERGKARDETKESGIKLELGLGEELTEEQKKKLEKEEEEAEALLLAGREAVQSRKFEGKMYTANTELQKEWQAIEGKEARADMARTVLIDGFAVSKETTTNQKWEAVKTITSDPAALKKLQNTKRARKKYEHEDFCCWCHDGGEVFTCRSCPRVAHGDCTGLSKLELKRMINYLCPQHNCYECGRSTAESGGLLFRCQICPLAFCEDCLPPGDLESVGETIPEFLLLGYGRTPQAHWIKCAGCLEHFKDHPEELATWKKEQAQIEAKARKAGLEV
ncbi:hypothetical protein JCM16303_000482 [Sporobolomyces ruberrimus]